MPAAAKIRVLVIDDSAIVRKILSETLAAETDIEVVGTAPDPIIALDKINRLRPDVLTLDVEMPRMDGLTFLKSLMKTNPLPVILISSLALNSCEVAMEALRIGAVDVLAKPNGPYSVCDLRASLSTRIRAAAQAKLCRNGPPNSAPPSEISRNGPNSKPAPPIIAAPPLTSLPVSTARANRLVIAIGASTGGTEAIAALLPCFPAQMPPIVITQHIPPVFSTAFAARLDHLSSLSVREAKDGEFAEPGLALLAPGGFHLVLTREGARYRVRIKEGPLVCYQRPSVDVLFASVAEAAGADSIGIILTGMGNDGAEGMLKMKRRGARTFAQDETSSVVFGMPREAIRLGCVDQVLALNRIGRAVMDTLV